MEINHTITGNNLSIVQSFAPSGDDFERKVASVWKKIELLKEVKYIENEEDKFSVAYRFIEIELEKVWKQKEELKQSLVAIVHAYSK